jgi:hypothetical protein
MRLWRSPESSSPCQGEDRGIEARQARWLTSGFSSRPSSARPAAATLAGDRRSSLACSPTINRSLVLPVRPSSTMRDEDRASFMVPPLISHRKTTTSATPPNHPRPQVEHPSCESETDQRRGEHPQQADLESLDSRAPGTRAGGAGGAGIRPMPRQGTFEQDRDELTRITRSAREGDRCHGEHRVPRRPRF